MVRIEPRCASTIYISSQEILHRDSRKFKSIGRFQASDKLLSGARGAGVGGGYHAEQRKFCVFQGEEGRKLVTQNN